MSMPKMPFLFRVQPIDAKHNPCGAPMYVVKLTTYWDLTTYNQDWMDDPILGNQNTHQVLVPDVDITEETFVYSPDDPVKNERDALLKMKELWAKMEI